MRRVPGSIPGRAQKFVSSLLAPLLYPACGAGAVDDKDLTVSTDQGNAWLFVHPTLEIIAAENSFVHLYTEWSTQVK